MLVERRRHRRGRWTHERAERVAVPLKTPILILDAIQGAQPMRAGKREIINNIIHINDIVKSDVRDICIAAVTNKFIQL